MPWHFPLLIGLTLLAASCRLASTPENKTKVGTLVNARRHDSLAEWQDKTIRGQSASDYAALLTAAIVPPGIGRETHIITLPGNEYRYVSKWKVQGSFTAGSAVPLTQDGYFLTAAHCVDQPQNFELVAIADNNSLKNAKTRLVWQGDYQNGGPDLALVHAPIQPAAAAILAPLETAKRHLPVLTSGFGSNGLPELKQGVSGGRIRWLGKIEGTASTGRWQKLGHTAPLAPGDSGGPLFDANGSLLGIHSGVSATAFFPLGLNQIWNYCGFSTAPDPAWIQALIAQDRKSMLHPKADKKR